jgi:hypothetical protein
MVWRVTTLWAVSVCLLEGVIIDRIAIIVGNSIVKDSDISRDLRVTSFLNDDPLNLSAEARKAAASRLVDQIFIRREIQLGNYATASPQEANKELDQLVQQRFKSQSSLQGALKKYGITAPDLRSHFLWQVTVLRFIDARFKPAVLVTDAEVENYYNEHRVALQRQHPSKADLENARPEITDLIAAQRVNKLFFSWLDEQRKATSIKYVEGSLQ